MADTEDTQERLVHEGEGETDRWLPVNIKQQILCAIANIEYGSVEVVIHDSRVVQIECRKKIRVARDEPGSKKTPSNSPSGIIKVH